MADPGSKAQVKAKSISDTTQGNVLGIPDCNPPWSRPTASMQKGRSSGRQEEGTDHSHHPAGLTSQNPRVSADQNLVKNSTDTINRSDLTNTQRTLELTEKRNCLPRPAGCCPVHLRILARTTVLRGQSPAHCRRAHLSLTNGIHNSPVSPEGHIHRCREQDGANSTHKTKKQTG